MNNNHDYNTILARLTSGETMDSILKSISEAASEAEKTHKANIKKKEAEAAIQKEREKKAKEKTEQKRAAVAKIITAINEYSEICGHGSQIPVDEIDEDLISIYAAAIERAIVIASLFS